MRTMDLNTIYTMIGRKEVEKEALSLELVDLREQNKQLKGNTPVEKKDAPDAKDQKA